jgi:hypothetical protein
MKNKLIKFLRFLKRLDCRHVYDEAINYCHYDNKSVWIVYCDCLKCDKPKVLRSEGYIVKTILGLFTEIKKL